MVLKVAFVEAAASAFGSSRSLLTLVKNLDRNYFRPVVACNEHNELVKWCEDANISVARLSLPGLEKQVMDSSIRTRFAKVPGPLTPTLSERILLPARILRDRHKFATAIKELKTFLAAHDVDILHLNNQPASNRFAYLAAGDRPIIQHLRDAPLTRSLHMAHLSKRCKHLFAISDFVREDAISALRVKSARITTLYNPVGDEFSDDPEAAARQRRIWGVQNDLVVYGMAGRIIAWKGVDRAISAYADLCRDPAFEQKTRLVLVGAAEVPTDYEKYCRDLAGDRLGRSILILPFTKNITDAFNGFDVVLHPIQKPEGFGRVIIEGMVCGAPPIGRGLGALPELIVDGVNGHLFEEDSELAQYMRRLFDDQEALKAMKANSIKTAEHFRPDALVRTFEEKYTALFSGT